MLKQILFALLFLNLSLFAKEKLCIIAYEDYSVLAKLYAENQVFGTDYLAFRDIPNLVHRFFPDRKNLTVLDYGCGAGLSTRVMRQCLSKDSTIVGIDISSDMLSQAIIADNESKYYQMDQVIPFQDSSFDLVYCNFVLFELPSKEEIVRVFTEIKRTMKPGSFLIATTGTPAMYDRNNSWATLNCDFIENDNLKSGDIAKVSLHLPDGIITFNDYFWTEEDYRECFTNAILTVVSIDYPLGITNECLDWQWQDETKVAPYVTFVLRN